MCFSATASFTSGVVLTGLGIISLKQVKEDKQKPLAGIPLLFGIQQFVEGFVWLSLSDPDWAYLQSVAMYSFLVIAQAIWPIWLPVAFIMFEDDPKKKKWMKPFLGTGILIASYYIYCLINVDVKASILHHHIFYDIDFPKLLIPAAAFFYVISTTVPQLISGNKKIKWMGLAIFLFYVISRAFFQPNLISVWCFFGTFIGILVYFVLRENAEQKKMQMSYIKSNDHGAQY
ncbi:MAG: DUF6629 family protein [Saprospiraceae bacterium]